MTIETIIDITDCHFFFGGKDCAFNKCKNKTIVSKPLFIASLLVTKLSKGRNKLSAIG